MSWALILRKVGETNLSSKFLSMILIGLARSGALSEPISEARKEGLCKKMAAPIRFPDSVVSGRSGGISRSQSLL